MDKPLSLAAVMGYSTNGGSLTGTFMSTLLEEAGSINAAAFSPDVTRISTSSDDCTIRVWNCSTGTTERVLNVPAERIHKVAISPCSRWICSSSSGNRTVQFHLWDFQISEPGVVVGEYSTWGSGALTCMAFSPDGCQLAMGWQARHYYHGRPPCRNYLEDRGDFWDIRFIHAGIFLGRSRSPWDLIRQSVYGGFRSTNSS